MVHGGGELGELLAKSVINQKYQRAAGCRSRYGDSTAGIETSQPLLSVQLVQRPEEGWLRKSLGPRTKFLRGLDRALDRIRREQHEVVQNSRARPR